MSIFNKLKKKKGEEIKDEVRSSGQRANSRNSALLLKQAWITEKAGDLSHFRKYIFIIDKKANKPEVKKAIELIYKVKVSDVNMINIKSKTKRLGRSSGKTPAYKKAIITLKEGHKIIDVMPT
ncbi:50S ribosomal protein L23 [Candidatus Wolfebacteria bacterium CG03_land_8_20_14_0_80_40_12]|uniref:Large ribosomal subunit protein uL23 n=1 Tax=Candidatus Wolfebacteria bacterium CG03_land_8_20_14_0_80_40_12 TaxID=1975069 RepID=A0A2M7B5V0_9BACT|nr:MAG: 50S ribosomal protein L23 [Candidatus Wolfebacteria bacterium CG03_land_8_20_14_0_80_40_12]